MAIIAILTADRVTKGAVRFMDANTINFPLSIYLRKEQVTELELEAKEGVQIEITIDSV